MKQFRASDLEPKSVLKCPLGLGDSKKLEMEYFRALKAEATGAVIRARKNMCEILYDTQGTDHRPI